MIHSKSPKKLVVCTVVQHNGTMFRHFSFTTYLLHLLYCHLKIANNLAAKATEDYNAQNYDEAVQNYRNAIQYFLRAAKCEYHPSVFDPAQRSTSVFSVFPTGGCVAAEARCRCLDNLNKAEQSRERDNPWERWDWSTVLNLASVF